MNRPRSNAFSSGVRPTVWKSASQSTQRGNVEIGQHRIVVFAGHGSWSTITDRDDLYFVLPKGCQMTFYVSHGDPTADWLGQIIDARRRGRSHCSSHAIERSSSLVILDDRKAREIAKRLQLAVTGTLGVILLAKERGIVQAIQPLLKALRDTNFRISETLTTEVLRRAKE